MKKTNTRHQRHRFKSIAIILVVLVMILVTTAGALAESTGWWDASYSNRIEFNISSVGSLTNYPTLLNITKQDNMQSDYDDLRFLNGTCSLANSSALKYEIDYNDNTRVSVWLKTNLSTGINQFCLYYGNSTVSSGEDASNVWDSNYVGVYHMNNIGSIEYDSTSQKNNITMQTTVDSVSSEFGLSRRFNRTDGDYGTFSTTTQINPYSVELIIKYRQYSDTSAYLLYGSVYSLRLEQYGGNVRQVGWTRSGVYESDFNYVIPLDVMRQYSFSGDTFANGNHNKLYVNGTIFGELNSYYQPERDGISHPSSGAFMDVEDLRLSNIIRNTTWVNMSYLLSEKQTEYVMFSTEESRNSAPTINTVLINSTNNEALTPFNAYCNATDADGDNVTYYYTIWFDGVIDVTGMTSQNYTQGIITKIYTYSNPWTGNYTLQCTASDGTINSTPVNSSQLTITTYEGGLTGRGGGTPPPDDNTTITDDNTTSPPPDDETIPPSGFNKFREDFLIPNQKFIVMTLILLGLGALVYFLVKK